MSGCEPLFNADASQAMKLYPDNLFSRKELFPNMEASFIH